MIESVQSIAERIKYHRSLEVSGGMINSAIGRSYARLNGQVQQFWLTRQQNNGGAQCVRNIVGDIIEILPGNGTTMMGDGQPVFRDSKLGQVLIQNHEGVHEYNAPAGIKEVEIFNRASYWPTASHEGLAKEIMVKVAGNEGGYSFSLLSEMLEHFKKVDEEIVELQQQRDDAEQAETEALQRRIDKMIEDRDSTLGRIHRFIRTNAELRFQPVLDPIQEEVKRWSPFQDILVIDGGPGTGKTTALIQRIKFLISHTIEEYRTDLTMSQKQKLFDDHRSWMFFSPNELLALYLRNSMVEEGLLSNNRRVLVWDSHKRQLLNAYGLTRMEQNRQHFAVASEEDSQIPLIRTERGPRDCLRGFLEMLRISLLEGLANACKVNLTGQASAVSQKIQNFIEHSPSQALESVIGVYNKLSDIYGDDVKELVNQANTLIKTESARIAIQLSKDPLLAQALSDLFASWDAQSEEPDEAEAEDVPKQDFQARLYQLAGNVVRSLALKQVDSSHSYSKRIKKVLELVPSLAERPLPKELPDLLLFRKTFDRLCKGVGVNVLSPLPGLYKQFRRKEVENASVHWDLELLKKQVKFEPQRLHPDEQALLIAAINHVVKHVLKYVKPSPERNGHRFLEAFIDHSRPVIGVDEATDFTAVDLMAIHSLGDYEISSVTYSGDPMQSMTVRGIKDWSELKINVNEDVVVKSLEVSYRQSPTLLSLARSVYRDVMGREAVYRSYMEPDVVEPKPLWFQSEDLQEQIDWVGARIQEIQLHYNRQLPSIAVFVPNEEDVTRVAKLLKKVDVLRESGIDVRACPQGEVLGEASQVRVYSIDVIKGLEFEAAFFVGMDRIGAQNDAENTEEILHTLRTLYVGLSRATFYLGVTSGKELDAGLVRLRAQFGSQGVISWA